MKVCVTTVQYIEVNHPIFDTLHDLHASDVNAVGTSEQYDEAVAVIEQAVGTPFFDPDKDDAEHTTPRITGVFNAWDFVPILEG